MHAAAKVNTEKAQMHQTSCKVKTIERYTVKKLPTNRSAELKRVKNKHEFRTFAKREIAYNVISYGAATKTNLQTE